MNEKKENRIKLYGVILGVITLALQHGIYLLANDFAHIVGVVPFSPRYAPIDDAIPLVSVFIIPYVWAYAFWGMAPMAVSKCKLDHFLNYMATYLVACLLGAAVLTFAPTYMDRVAEGLFDTGGGFLGDLRRFWYGLDGGKMAYNLFPSFHCINSTVSYLGVCRRKEIPLWFRIYSLVTSVCIFASTLFVKQHFFPDVISGIAIAVVAYLVCMKWNWGRMFLPLIHWHDRFIRKKRQTEFVQ